MTGTKQLISYISMLPIALSLGLIILSGLPTQAQVKSGKTTTASSDLKSLESQIEINFETKEPGEGEPEQTVGAGSRSTQECTDPQNSQPLTLLVPPSTVPLTVAQRPVFLVYFPKTVAKQAELSLRDEQGNGIYQTTFNLSDTPGILNIQLPATAPALEIGQKYQWSIAMICYPDDRLRDQVVDAWIQRTELPASLSQQLEAASIPEQASLYAQNGIWYDTISTLAEFASQSENSTVAANAWQQLLTSETVKLEQMLGMPLIQAQHEED
jgi:Domain of Unknown Function (DUF928)